MIKRSERTGSRRGMHLLKKTIGEIHAANAHIPPEEIEKIVDDAVREIRAERRRRSPRGSCARKGRQ